ncbi:MAG TPA: crossover junction endodeoxyribonuclease RuvC [Myxococcales bacterium LLY-WYZ-16_1]|nr:crossover junction endodeoxyribonuclease RuvC [Myxococcales bacterium LLY-WYZ-16_1]
MTILGVDPGSRCAGWALVQPAGSRVEYLGHGTIRLDPKAPLSERLAVLFDALKELCRDGAPDTVVVESLFQHKNARSALVLGHARGVVLLCAHHSGATLLELTPAEIKKAVTGRGRADKHQVQQMVVALLGLRTVPAADAADALAVAVAGSVYGRARQMVHGVEVGR